jgi:hypothetical protein
MKKLITTLFAITAIIGVKAQEEQKPKLLEPYGYIRYEGLIDTRKMVESREGELMMYPLDKTLDNNGKDINEVTQFKMLSLQTRLGTRVNGPDAFGAKTSGVIEMDFYGVSDNVTRMIRLRHAYMKLDWGMAKLTMGHTWHMIIVPDCNPGVIGFGAAAPFHPLNRSAQMRLDLTFAGHFNWGIAAATYGYHNSAGPTTEAQRNSGLPDLHTQFSFTNEKILTGFTGGVKWLKPRLVTAGNNKTEETLMGYDLQAFLKVSLGKISFKTAGIYGQNLTMYSMLGGFGRALDDVAVDDYSYLNITSYAFWADFNIKFNGFVSAGLFFGYSGNKGAKKDFDATTKWGRGLDLHHIMRISPRVAFTSGKTEFAFEYAINQAVYATGYDTKYKVNAKNDPVFALRYLISAKYSF